MSASFFHTHAPIYLAILELILGSTFFDTSKNCCSVYLGRKSFLNLDCKGLDSLVISLHVPNIFAHFIWKSYWSSAIYFPVPRTSQVIHLYVCESSFFWKEDIGLCHYIGRSFHLHSSRNSIHQPKPSHGSPCPDPSPSPCIPPAPF
jgi:hypothetical protein